MASARIASIFLACAQDVYMWKRLPKRWNTFRYALRLPLNKAMPRLIRSPFFIFIILCESPSLASAQTLIEAINAATRNNPRIHAVDAQVLASRAGVMRTQAALFPKVSGSADIGRNITETYAPGSPPSRYRTAPQGLGLDVHQTLFDGGKTIANIRSSGHVLDASQASAREITQLVIYDTAAVYLDVLRDSEIIRLEKRFLGFLTAQKVTIDKLRKFNEVTNTDVAQVDARIAAAHARAGQAEANFQASRARYAEVVGQDPGVLSFPRPIDAFLPKSLEQCLAIAKIGRAHV